jgi:hypothetical protein
VLLLGTWTDVGAALTIRAEQAHIKTIGGMQGGAWNLWSDGECIYKGNAIHYA